MYKNKTKIKQDKECEVYLYHLHWTSNSWFGLQIVNWKSHLKFPEEAVLSREAKDLINSLLCSVRRRLGSKGADEIKVCPFLHWFSFKK